MKNPPVAAVYDRRRACPTVCIDRRYGWLGLITLMLGLLAAHATAAPRPDVVVAADGTGQFTSLQDAINSAPMNTDPAAPRWVILVKPGTYRERIYVQRERGHLHVLGEDADKTIVTYDLNAHLPGPDGKPIGTFRTSTLQIDGDGEMAETDGNFQLPLPPKRS